MPSASYVVSHRPRVTVTRTLAAVVLLITGAAACARPAGVPAAERRAIADSLSALVTRAYDFSKPNAAQRLLALYPDSGRVISAAGGRVTSTQAALKGEIESFWQRVGQNMQGPRFVLGSSYVDVITPDAAVMTFTYSIPHTTPDGASHVVTGAWTTFWRRDGGRWQIVQEHLSDAPPATTPAMTPSTTPMADSAAMSHQH